MPLRFDRVFFIIPFVIGLLAANGWFTFYNIRHLHQEAGWVTHTYRVIGTVQDIPWLLTEAESAQRGYLLTGDPRHLDLYKASVPAVNDRLHELSRLTVDPAQKYFIPALKSAINKRLKILHDNLGLRASRSRTRREMINKDKTEMDNVRSQIMTFLDGEKRLLQIRSQRASNAYNAALLFSLLANFMCMAAMLVIIFALRRRMVQ